MSDLLEALITKPVGGSLTPSVKTVDPTLTASLEVRDGAASAVLQGESGTINTGTALAFLEHEGLDPSEWEATGFKKSVWGEDKESVNFTFRRVAPVTEAANIDDLLASIETYEPGPWTPPPFGTHGFLVLLGDMQFGKIDGDGVEGTLARTIDSINRAADALQRYSRTYSIEHVFIAFLGDHIEGFVSQGGANVWRTPLTLNEQIRLTRRVMLHALTTFAPLTGKLTIGAVPGNHGEAIRINGKGVTRYDDSHDTESLIAVYDAAVLSGKFEHVNFLVPDTDELTIVTDVAGTRVAAVHGHFWRPGKHFDWWKGQAFNPDSALSGADVMVAGHLHHEFVDSDGRRTFIQPPSMESESTWFRHNTGTGGAPGLIVALTKDGEVPVKEVIR